MMLNLLDCIAHGTTPQEFLASFKYDAKKAVKHLVDFYSENGGDADDDEIDDAKIYALDEFLSMAAAATLGRRGGKSTSNAKRAAARVNGKRGGRPRKQPS